MARSYAGLANMAVKFGFRLAKAREGSQHLGMPVRYLLEAALGTWSGSLARWRKSEPSAEQRSFKRTIQTIPSEPTWPASFSRNAWADVGGDALPNAG